MKYCSSRIFCKELTSITDTENYEVKDIPSHPLHRSELEKLGGRQGLEKCPNPFVQLWLHPSLVLPQVFIEFEDFKQVPELIVLPAQQGISVSLRCGGHLTSTEIYVLNPVFLANFHKIFKILKTIIFWPKCPVCRQRWMPNFVGTIVK